MDEELIQKKFFSLSNLSIPLGFIQAFNFHYYLWLLKFHSWIFRLTVLVTGRKAMMKHLLTHWNILFFLPPHKQEASPGSPGARDQSGKQLTTGGFHCRGTSWRRCRLRPGPNSLPAMSAEVKRPSPRDGAPYAKCTSWEEPLTALIFPTHKLLVQDVIWEWKGCGWDDWGQLLPRGLQQQGLH